MEPFEQEQPDSMAVERVKAAFEQLAEAVKNIISNLAEAFRPVVEGFCKELNKFTDTLLHHANTRPKWWHLYKHATKARVRKKYRQLLMKQLIEKITTAERLEVIT